MSRAAGSRTVVQRKCAPPSPASRPQLGGVRSSAMLPCVAHTPGSRSIHLCSQRAPKRPYRAAMLRATEPAVVEAHLNSLTNTMLGSSVRSHSPATSSPEPVSWPSGSKVNGATSSMAKQLSRGPLVGEAVGALCWRGPASARVLSERQRASWAHSPFRGVSPAPAQPARRLRHLVDGWEHQDSACGTE